MRLSFAPRKASSLLALLLAVVLLSIMPFGRAQANSGDLDEIVNYTITVDVNDDATLDMVYHVDWLVLDSTSAGPLEWVRIGIPNKHYLSLEPLSDTIKKIKYSTSGGNYARIDLDRAYYAGEVASFDFELVQDYMYQVNRDNEGETVYEFTPGWFDDLEVDSLVIRWNEDKVERFMPAALQEGGYYTWKTSLDNGERYTVTVAYKNDAYAFDISKNIESEEESSSASYYEDEDDSPFAYLFAIIVLGFWGVMGYSFVKSIVNAVRNIFDKSSGFTAGKKITRTKVVYYPSCPSCGAPRAEGKDSCEYCGRSLIQSEETITEKDIPPEEKVIKGKRTDGEYAFSTMPNTYLRVHVVPIPVSHHSSSGSGGRSSCAHSSCACACACGCACACACAGGGRAGCSAKDFYDTNLKLSQLENK